MKLVKTKIKQTLYEKKGINMSVQLMQKYAEDLEKSGVGYDQGNRWSFNPSAWFPSWLRRSPTTPPTLD